MFQTPIDFSKRVNGFLRKREVLTWGWDIDPTDNAHSSYPVFADEHTKQVFVKKERLAREIQCVLCEAKYGPCEAESCFFKPEVPEHD